MILRRKTLVSGPTTYRRMMRSSVTHALLESVDELRCCVCPACGGNGPKQWQVAVSGLTLCCADNGGGVAIKINGATSTTFNATGYTTFPSCIWYIPNAGIADPSDIGLDTDAYTLGSSCTTPTAPPSPIYCTASVGVGGVVGLLIGIGDGSLFNYVFQGTTPLISCGVPHTISNNLTHCGQVFAGREVLAFGGSAVVTPCG